MVLYIGLLACSHEVGATHKRPRPRVELVGGDYIFSLFVKKGLTLGGFSVKVVSVLAIHPLEGDQLTARLVGSPPNKITIP